ncbi:unnamed protein product [Lepeophtheirus salmonis]|uniref:(salmon louse) hypothetical protein n=1 Tax=Lepeophtheirus salmonis TaxID=72036 RepID=A0A7R8D1C5_LEPSM|nr:unnamed protein product [Lepeophtheirus salmonis]CAF2994332.1 unnamed protein product [Lepeophtheirus salmonis]
MTHKKGTIWTGEEALNLLELELGLVHESYLNGEIGAPTNTSLTLAIGGIDPSRTCLETILPEQGLIPRDTGGLRYKVGSWTTLEKSKIAALIATNPGYNTSAILEELVQQLAGRSRESILQQLNNAEQKVKIKGDKGAKDVEGRQAILDCSPNRRNETKSIVLNRKTTKTLWFEDPRGLVGQFLLKGSYVPKVGGIELQIRKWWGRISSVHHTPDSRGRGLMLLDSFIREQKGKKLDLGVAWLDFDKAF